VRKYVENIVGELTSKGIFSMATSTDVYLRAVIRLDWIDAAWFALGRGADRVQPRLFRVERGDFVHWRVGWSDIFNQFFVQGVLLEIAIGIWLLCG